ncbi:hypothetical protein DSO57_1003265 [Entomophthora muscae]|uniref:Uncharacterized protein n=1 Tax=Entomophthora muscae TaxID=34485 RepID=A0ACC2SLG1_9FUNG|nr:hypothetical protein DSO57_1003265 [Entomophthora muscae]
MKEIPAPPLPAAAPTQDFSKLCFVYITVLGLVNQVVPYTGSWRPLATALNYLVHITPIVHMAFQAQPVSPVGVQSDSGMGCDSLGEHFLEHFSFEEHFPWVTQYKSTVRNPPCREKFP